MSHPLAGEIKKIKSVWLREDWLAVTVWHRPRGCLTIKPKSLCMAKADIEWLPLPDKFKVLDSDGCEMVPSKGKMFLISAETFDPLHLLVEVTKGFSNIFHRRPK